jgi:hypothetical protein
MRRVLVVLFVVLASLVVAPAATPQLPDADPFPCADLSTGQAFGTAHISDEAMAGHLGAGGHSVGGHLGFAQCVVP